MPEKIIVLTREHIGDLVCTTPALRSLRRLYPKAHIAVEVGQRAAGVLEHNPHIDEIVIRRDHQGLLGKLAFVRFLRRERFDLGVILDNSADMILYLWLGNVTRRIGLVRKRKFSGLLTDQVAFDRSRHEMIDNFRDVVAHLGGDVSDSSTEVFPMAEDGVAVSLLLQREGVGPDEMLVGLNPGASMPANRWLPERFAELADRLSAHQGLRVILLGGPSDVPIAEAIAGQAGPALLVLTGRLTVLQLAEMMRRCRVVVTGDTGPMHLAVAMKTPVVARFGPAVPQESGPGYAIGHRIIRKVARCEQCTKDRCVRDRACMRAITATEVEREVLDLLEMPAGPGSLPS